MHELRHDTDSLRHRAGESPRARRRRGARAQDARLDRRAGRVARLIAALLALAAAAAPAQQSALPTDDPGESVNFAYSAILGTGIYRVGDRDIYVFKLPFRWRQQRPQLTDSGFSQPGITWLLPVTAGIYDFDLGNPNLPSTSDLGTITFLPGVELYWPRPSGWEFRPYAQAGLGGDLLREEWSKIYSGGFRAQYPLVPFDMDTTGLYFGSRIVIAGYDENEGEVVDGDDSLGYVSLGLDLRFPQRWRLLDRPVYVSLMGYANLYFNEAKFVNAFEEPESVDREYFVGVSIGGVPELEVLGIGFERVGIGFEAGPNIRAVRLFASFPF